MSLVPSGACPICYQPVHGNHFGANCCRACAAFFRRTHVVHQQQFECRKKDGKCSPNSDGRWHCKKCRADRCIAVGMRPDNIQLSRDLLIHICQDRKKKHFSSVIPLSVECFSENRRVDTYITQEGQRLNCVTYFDLSPILSDAEYILGKVPKLDGSTKSKSSLEQLAFGLREIRKVQMLEDLPEMRTFGKTEQWNHWVKEMRRAGRWIMHFPQFRVLETEEKMTILKTMWQIFSRLERIAMTAEMRRDRRCKDGEFVYSSDQRIDFNKLKFDSDWCSNVPEQQMRFFIGQLSNWFCEALIRECMKLQPSDVELSFMLCNLCFHLAGKQLGGQIQETTERLQDVLANDLHEYYAERDRLSRYSHRLTKMLNFNRQFQALMAKRKEAIYLANSLNIFRVRVSHPDVFHFPC